MTDEAKYRDQVARGHTAETLLNELDAAFDALEQDCFEAFRNSDLHDDLGRKNIRMYVRVAEDVKKRFKAAVRTGEAARRKLEKPKRPSLVRRIASV